MKNDGLPIIDSWRASNLQTRHRISNLGVHDSAEKLPPFYGRLVTQASRRFCDSLAQKSRSSLLGLNATEKDRTDIKILPFTGYTHTKL